MAIISTGDEVVPPTTRKLAAGQVRDATASALAGLVTDAGGIPTLAGIVPDEPGALKTALADALADVDLVVVSAGSSVGARDETADAVGCPGGDLVPRFGHQTRQAHPAGGMRRGAPDRPAG